MNTETSDYSTMTGTSTGSNTGLNGNTTTDGKVHRVAQKAHEAVDKVEQTLGTTGERVMNWHQEYGDMAREQVRANPLAVVAGAFAVGYLFAKITR